MAVIFKKKQLQEVELTENKNTYFQAAIFGKENSKSAKIKNFAIFTSENPGGEQLSREENKEKLRQLKKDLKDGFYYYVPLNGMFEGSKEHLFMVINITKSAVEKLCDYYKQASFIFGTHDNIEYWSKPSSGGKYELAKPYELAGIATYTDSIDRNTAKFYSARHNTSFVFPFEWLEKVKEEDMDKELVEMSTNEDLTGYHRYINRSRIKKGK